MSTASRALFPLAVLLLLASVAPPRAARAEETVLFYDRYMRTVSHRPTSQGGNTVDSSRAQVLISIGDRRVAFMSRNACASTTSSAGAS